MIKTDDREIHHPVMICHLDPVFEGANNHAPVHSPDLSTRGIFINTPHNLPVGSVLKLQFRLAMTDVEIAVEAEVRHVVDGVGAEVEFVSLSPKAEHAIERELQETVVDFGPGEKRKTPRKIMRSDLPRRMWDTWVHGEVEPPMY